MKNQTLKMLSLGLAVTTTLSTSTPVFAYDVDEHDNSIESVEYQNTEDEDYTNNTNVFAEIGSEYKVTIPKVVVLSGTSKAAKYYVKVEGDIAGYEKVSVVPDDSFKLFASGKDAQIATIEQDKTIWHVSDFDTDANGLVSAPAITAGKWTGAFNFNINLENNDVSALPEEKVLGDLVVPDTNEWKGQVLSDIYIMEVDDTGILEATNDGKDVSDALEITSSNEDVVKVENKQLKAVNAGQATITTVYEDKSFSVKIKVIKASEETEATPHEHVAGEVVRENEIAATYKKDGSYDEVTYCADCGEELSRTTKTVDKFEVAGGLFDENDNLIKSWDELLALGLDIEKDYTNSSSDPLFYENNPSSGYSVFTNNNLSGKLVIPNTVTSIGNSAFYNCTSLESITIPDSVTSIGQYAFYSVPANFEVNLPNLENLGNQVFYKSGITKFVSGDKLTTIGNNTFRECTSLTSVTIPDSVTRIGWYAFSECSSLKSITIPDSVTFIDVGAFYHCTSLASVTIPNTVTTIGYFAFRDTSLKSVTIPDSITSIGNDVFSDCASLTSIKYRGVTYTDKNALNNKIKSDGVNTNVVGPWR